MSIAYGAARFGRIECEAPVVARWQTTNVDQSINQSINQKTHTAKVAELPLDVKQLRQIKQCVMLNYCLEWDK